MYVERSAVWVDRDGNGKDIGFQTGRVCVCTCERPNLFRIVFSENTRIYTH